MTTPAKLLGQFDGLWITGIVNGPNPTDPPYGAGCPIDGNRTLIIELFYIEDQVLRLGLLTFGAEAFGGYIGAPPSTPEWVDVTDRCYGATVNRGNLRPNIDEDVDTFIFDLLDPQGDVIDWRPPWSLASPNLNTPVRVGFRSIQDGTYYYYQLYTGRIGRMSDVHDTPDRGITIETYGTKSDLVTSLLNERCPRETAQTRITRILNEIGWANGFDPSWPNPGLNIMLEADPEERYDTDALAYTIIQEAAVSAGFHVGITRLGQFRLHPIIDDPGPLVLTIADCYDGEDIDAVATSIEYVSDASEVLNVVQLYNKKLPNQSAEAIDPTSVEIWGRRSQGYGFPTYVVCDSAGFTQQLADDILAGTANIVNRIERVTFNTRTDQNWWEAGKKFEIGSQVIVRRYHPRLIEFRCTIIGLDWIFSEDGYIEGNINLSTLDQTVK